MHAAGRALAVEMNLGAEHLFSSKFACPVCNYLDACRYALKELESRLPAMQRLRLVSTGSHELAEISRPYLSSSSSFKPSSRKAPFVSSRVCFERPSGGLTSIWIVSFKPDAPANRESTLV